VVTSAMKMLDEKASGAMDYNSRELIKRNGWGRAHTESGQSVFRSLRVRVIYSHRILASIEYPWRILLHALQ